ncbi:MAG: hypothetical protein MUE94_13970 [Verrucomicrobia bacterium]|nr:hypothetical protein [Verrucomicrobiota bacterium]
MKPTKRGGRTALIVGLGLDSDGHKRLTTGENFVLAGGTQDTHEDMTEKAVKINEKLRERGKRLEQVSREEFDDIALSVGLRRHQPERN